MKKAEPIHRIDEKYIYVRNGYRVYVCISFLFFKNKKKKNKEK